MITIFQILLIILMSVSILAIVSTTIYTIIINTKKNEGMIHAQIEAGKMRRSDHVTTLSYDATKKIISDLISIYASDAILMGGLNIKKPEELSIVIDDNVVEICTKVWTAMSEELKVAALFYVTEKHLKTTIKDEVRLSLIARLSLK